MSKYRRTSPGNFNEDLDQLIVQLDQPRPKLAGLADKARKYLPRRAARCEATHNRMLFGEVWRERPVD
ncbi:MAG TPA: hypothetical protein VFO51_07445 [Sphingomicrobium sp.]|nr:hypothetical protein [Sphingomicrobium sp.]